MSSVAALDSSELRLFDDEESALVIRGLVALEREAPRDAQILRRMLAQLTEMSAMVQSLPSLYATESFAGEKRSHESLIEHLCASDGLTGELGLPLKSTMSRTFLTAKIQFLRGFVRATSNQIAVDDKFKDLDAAFREELAQSIYTQLAEELLLALLRKPDIRTTTKRHAASQLIAIWENAEIEIDDFCPLLESTWHARNRVNADLGTLLGTSEFFQLVCEDCAPQFIDFFARDEVSVQHKQAFEEFLFDMTFEEINALRRAMKDQSMDNITPEWAAGILGRPIERETEADRIEPIALYRSYFRRQLASDFRIVAGRRGPRRTAEAYMMIYLLDEQKMNS